MNLIPTTIFDYQGRTLDIEIEIMLDQPGSKSCATLDSRKFSKPANIVEWNIPW